MDISEPTPGRLRAALEFIQEGRCVDFHGVGLALASKGNLSVFIPYSGVVGTHDQERALCDIRDAETRIDELLSIAPDIANMVSASRRTYFLIYSDGKTEVEVARLTQGGLRWT
jgi:hypothetical protein